MPAAGGASSRPAQRAAGQAAPATHCLCTHQPSAALLAAPRASQKPSLAAGAPLRLPFAGLRPPTPSIRCCIVASAQSRHRGPVRRTAMAPRRRHASCPAEATCWASRQCAYRVGACAALRLHQAHCRRPPPPLLAPACRSAALVALLACALAAAAAGSTKHGGKIKRVSLVFACHLDVVRQIAAAAGAGALESTWPQTRCPAPPQGFTSAGPEPGYDNAVISRYFNEHFPRAAAVAAALRDRGGEERLVFLTHVGRRALGLTCSHECWWRASRPSVPPHHVACAKYGRLPHPCPACSPGSCRSSSTAPPASASPALTPPPWPPSRRL